MPFASGEKRGIVRTVEETAVSPLAAALAMKSRREIFPSAHIDSRIIIFGYQHLPVLNLFAVQARVSTGRGGLMHLL